jgi:hypothetical protein
MVDRLQGVIVQKGDTAVIERHGPSPRACGVVMIDRYFRARQVSEIVHDLSGRVRSVGPADS